MRMTSCMLMAALLIALIGCEETINQTITELYPSPLYSSAPPFDNSIFKVRRDNLLEDLPAGSFILITTNDIYTRNGTITYEFHPAPSFFYLTGFDEPNAIAVIRADGTQPGSSELVLFVEERTPVEELWMGPVHGIDGALTVFGADSAYDIDVWSHMVQHYLSSGTFSGVYANLDDNPNVREIYASIPAASSPALDVRSYVDALRPIKSDDEIECIRRAARISAQAFKEAIQRIKPSLFEFEVEAVFDLVFRINGCTGVAFPSIIASGPNINTLHYDANTRMMQDGDLVMIDIGAEYEYYASDVTRTLPVNGSFSYEQAVVYDIVLHAYEAVIASAVPGMSYSSLYYMQRDLILDEMLQAGIITGTRDEILSSGRYRQYIPAGLAHSVGLDVHDPWYPYSGRVLRENLVLAIEPHIYLDPNDATVAPAYRGVCARIENDVLITSTGPETLSGELPITRHELEALMQE